MRVWGIEYTIKIRGKWLKVWAGPCGIYAMTFTNDARSLTDMLKGRPFFFRTRKQARDEAERRSNTWVKARAVAYELTWRKV